MIFFPMGWLFDFQGDKHDTNIVSLTNHLNFTALALWNLLEWIERFCLSEREKTSAFGEIAEAKYLVEKNTQSTNTWIKIFTFFVTKER